MEAEVRADEQYGPSIIGRFDWAAHEEAEVFLTFNGLFRFKLDWISEV